MSKFKVGDFVKVTGTDTYGVVSLVYHDVYPTDDIEFVLNGKCYQVDVGDRYCRDVKEEDLEPADRDDFVLKTDDELEPEKL